MSDKAFNLSPPNLPIPPSTYDRLYQDQLNNVLRLFFNLLVSSINAEQYEDTTYEDTIYTVTKLLSLTNVEPNTRTFVTDANTNVFYTKIDNTIAGGTYGVPVIYDGTNWRIG
jgi:flagellar motor switch protein FliM